MYKEDFNLPAKIAERTFTPDLDGLIAWLETREPNGRYDYMDCAGGCLIDQFLDQFLGRRTTYADYTAFGRASRIETAIAVQMPWTYGAALERARTLREQHP